jgi:RHS repeat-associated protein
VISDRKIAVDELTFTANASGTYSAAATTTGLFLHMTGSNNYSFSSTPDGTAEYYTAEILRTTDYYAFGMEMPGRSFASESGYRYGFNGQENDKEVFGPGNIYSFEYRLLDTRIARWFSIDLLQARTPFFSPYTAFNDNPIFFVDPDGLYSIGDKAISSKTFLNILTQWVVKVNTDHKVLDHTNNPSNYRNQTNSEKLDFLYDDYMSKKQAITEVGDIKNFAYHKDMGHYVDCGGFPLDMHHFLQCATLADGLPDAVVKWAALDEENDQAKLDPNSEGFTSAFAPEDMLSNYLGIYFGDALNEGASFESQMEVFMNEVSELFTTNDVKNGNYLDSAKIEEMKSMMMEYYGTNDLTTFNKDSAIYYKKSIDNINLNAKEGTLPLTSTIEGTGK